MKEEAKKWIEQAEADLRKAKVLFDNKEFDGVAFNCQQTVEKCLKGLIIKKSNILAKIHDLVALGKMAELPENLLKKIKSMSGLYTESRYGFIGEEIPAKKFKEEDVVEFLEISKEVLEWAKKKI